MRNCIDIIDESARRKVFATVSLAASKTLALSAIWTCFRSLPKKLAPHSHFSRRKVVAIGHCWNCRTWIWAENGANWATTSTWTTRQKHQRMVRHRDQIRRPGIRCHWKCSRDSTECRSAWLCTDSVRLVITFGFMKCAQRWWLWKIALWSVSIGRLVRVCRITCAQRPIRGWWGNSWHYFWKDYKNTKVWIWVVCISLASVWVHTFLVSLVPICQGSGV